MKWLVGLIGAVILTVTFQNCGSKFDSAIISSDDQSSLGPTTSALSLTNINDLKDVSMTFNFPGEAPDTALKGIFSFSPSRVYYKTVRQNTSTGATVDCGPRGLIEDVAGNTWLQAFKQSLLQAQLTNSGCKIPIWGEGFPGKLDVSLKSGNFSCARAGLASISATTAEISARVRLTDFWHDTIDGECNAKPNLFTAGNLDDADDLSHFEPNLQISLIAGAAYDGAKGLRLNNKNFQVLEAQMPTLQVNKYYSIMFRTRKIAGPTTSSPKLVLYNRGGTVSEQRIELSIPSHSTWQTIERTFLALNPRLALDFSIVLGDGNIVDIDQISIIEVQ